MKLTKGDFGYLKKQKKKQITIAVLEFAAVAALLTLGYLNTGSNKTIATVAAVLGCLPACKALVGVITLMPHSSMEREKADAIISKTESLTMVYDIVMTSKEKIMPIDCLAISNDTICGYVSSSKVDTTKTATHIKSMLSQNRYGNVSVKLFPEYTAFLTRVASMNHIAETRDTNIKETEKEEQVKQLMLNISI